MTQSAAPTLTEVTTVTGTAHANPPDSPLVRVSDSDHPGPVIEAIARHMTESGSVFLELPDGRLTIVLHLDGKTPIQRSL